MSIAPHDAAPELIQTELEIFTVLGDAIHQLLEYTMEIGVSYLKIHLGALI